MPSSPAARNAFARLPSRLYTCFAGTPAIARSSRRLGLRCSFFAHTRIAFTISSFVMIVLAVSFIGELFWTVVLERCFPEKSLSGQSFSEKCLKDVLVNHSWQSSSGNTKATHRVARFGRGLVLGLKVNGQWLAAAKLLLIYALKTHFPGHVFPALFFGSDNAAESLCHTIIGEGLRANG